MKPRRRSSSRRRKKERGKKEQKEEKLVRQKWRERNNPNTEASITYT